MLLFGELKVGIKPLSISSNNMTNTNDMKGHPKNSVMVHTQI